MKRAIILLLPAVLFAADKPAKPAPTFNKDIAPIFYDRCVTCHREGNVAPMSLITYSETRPWIKSIRENVAAHKMPPWTADPHYGKFLNDRQLTKEQIDTVVAWIDSGAKEGSPEDLPPAPKFAKGWNLGQPDQVFEMAEEFTVPTDGVVDYQHFLVPTNFTEDKWIRGAEIRNVDPSVVHHVIVFIQPPRTDHPKPFGISMPAVAQIPQEKPAVINGRKFQRGTLGYFLTATGPGERGTIFPEGSAMRIPAGSNLIFQIHYTPKGKPVKDRAKVGLFYAKGPAENEIRTIGVQNGVFRIPAGEANYRVESAVTFNEDARIWALIPHMHLRGKSFEYRLITPDGKSRVVLSVPNYDFNWQMLYSLAEPIIAPKGSRMECTAYYDNSKQNRYNPDATRDITWGDQTWDEMMIGFMTFSLDSQRHVTVAATSDR